jgi:HNH endonuclease
MKKIPTDISEWLEYSIVSGRLYWKKKPAVRVHVGSLAGTTNRKDGYTLIQFRGTQYPASRVAWFICFGSEPDGLIDHINHNTGCNGIHNLRDLSQFENSRHRKIPAVSGHLNIKPNGRKWGVRIGHKWLGTYPTIEDAILVRDAHLSQR